MHNKENKTKHVFYPVYNLFTLDMGWKNYYTERFPILKPMTSEPSTITHDIRVT